MPNNYLFGGNHINEYLRHKITRAEGDVEGLDAKTVRQNSVEDLIKIVCSNYSVTPLQLLLDQKEKDVTEQDVDVSGDPERFPPGHRTGPRYIKGKRVTIKIPFTGNNELFNYGLNEFHSTAILGILVKNKLVFLYDLLPNQDIEIATKAYQNWIATIDAHVKNVSQHVEAYYDVIQKKVRKAIELRKKRIGGNDEDTDRLNELLGVIVST